MHGEVTPHFPVINYAADKRYKKNNYIKPEDH